MLFRSEWIPLARKSKCASNQKINFVSDERSRREITMWETAAAVTNLIAYLRQRSGIDRSGFAPLGREIEQRAITAKPMDEVQVARHPEVQSGRRGKGKVRKNGEHAGPGAARRYAGFIFLDRHGVFY